MPSDVDNIEQLTNVHNHQSNEEWLGSLQDTKAQTQTYFWSKDPRQLITNAQIEPKNFTVGNGADIYASTILPTLETANYEIIFVTCFWARSQCLTQLGETLIKLSRRASTRPKVAPKLRVRLCFSSRSLTQKLFHTTSTDGYIYEPSQWASKLGLPHPERLCGLDLQVKSLFFLPFSVMHPKFVIIDRKMALLPSCNLSYESWFEGCLTLNGPVVDRLLLFWKDIWGPDDLPSLIPTTSNTEEPVSPSPSLNTRTTTRRPCPHHRLPNIRSFLSPPPLPPTPLNTYLTHLIATAKSSITILTPNLTCQHVINCLLASLLRGVSVTIITNRRMMVLEQIFTAGTLTEICVWRLKKRHKRLVAQRKQSLRANADLESGLPERKSGRLKVGYFRSKTKYKKIHFKCTIVDGKRVVLGSGNMDRASWFTSQELGVAVEEDDVAGLVLEEVRKEMEKGGVREGGGKERWVEWV